LEPRGSRPRVRTRRPATCTHARMQEPRPLPPFVPLCRFSLLPHLPHLVVCLIRSPSQCAPPAAPRCPHAWAPRRVPLPALPLAPRPPTRLSSPPLCPPGSLHPPTAAAAAASATRRPGAGQQGCSSAAPQQRAQPGGSRSSSTRTIPARRLLEEGGRGRGEGGGTCLVFDRHRSPEASRVGMQWWRMAGCPFQDAPRAPGGSGGPAGPRVNTWVRQDGAHVTVSFGRHAAGTL
jgi:hypothetical protein